ncbi:hypothetical protein [Neolewinella antarctica]
MYLLHLTGEEGQLTKRLVIKQTRHPRPRLGNLPVLGRRRRQGECPQ